MKQTPESKRRLAILVHLSLARRFRAPVADVREAVDLLGYAASLDAIRADADWLDETGLAVFDRDNQALEATERGLEVASGHLAVSGVAVRGPGV